MRRFVGFADMQRSAIGIGVNGHRANAHLAQSANDAQSDLAAIGDQNLREHGPLRGDTPVPAELSPEERWSSFPR